MNAKNISRYTYRDTAFLGWRLALMRKGEQYTQYFSDRQFGGSRASFRAAITRRNAILRALSVPGATPASVFDAYRQSNLEISPEQSSRRGRSVRHFCPFLPLATSRIAEA